MSCDIDRKKMSIARNKSEDDYFSARPQIDCNDRRKVFESGFELAWNARQMEIDRLRDEAAKWQATAEAQARGK